jgi:rSAM/selenodomain-associated transferase 1
MKPVVALAVVAKEPVPGRVKTRLCPPCTLDEAAQIARASLADTLDVVAATPARRRIVVLDGSPGPWLPRGFRVLPQVSGALDVRLAAAFAAVHMPIVLIGMDTPQVTPQLLGGACEQLMSRRTDAVLGRAEDGGWWALGMRRPRPDVFHGVVMSTSTTGEQQRQRLDALGLRTSELDVLRDVDDIDDATAVARLVPNSRFARSLDAIAEGAITLPAAAQ